MMSETSSRRVFLGSAAAGASLASASFASAADAAKPGAIEAEIQRRAAWHVRQKRLVVDYYRIRRMLAYPLPARSLAIPSMVVPSINGYPWVTWMLWALEERIYSLGWAGEWSGEQRFIEAASRDLEGLAQFPQYCEASQPDLATGHAGRLLWVAGREWKWVSAALKAKLRAACARHIAELLPKVDAHFGPVRSKQDLQPVAPLYRKLHNIPLIGTIGTALAANVIGHAEAGRLNALIGAIFETILDVRKDGYTEAAAYDGYILDFIGDWLQTLPATERNRLLDHPRMNDALEESYRLSAPGSMAQLAELADVEPRQMPFHQAAQVKLARWRPTPVRNWLLASWPVDWMRADGLGRLRPLATKPQGRAPVEPAADAHYAVVLRSGWSAQDVAVAMSSTNSPSGHLPPDNGTIVIGTAGEWILADPGYQQYMGGEERVFTLGPKAHNAPLIGGLAPNAKKAHIVELKPGRATLDLSECYPAKAAVEAVRRNVWLAAKGLVVVADELRLREPASVQYHWHGHAKASWWADGGAVLVSLENHELWIATPHKSLDLDAVSLLPGSRGPLTAEAEFPTPPGVVWWVFSLGAKPAMTLDPTGCKLTIAGQDFTV